MKNFILPILFLISLNVTLAQQRLPFGEIPEADMQMTVYNKDSMTSTVVLFDYASVINNNPKRLKDKLTYHRHIRIKLLNKSAFDWADVEIPLYKKYKTVVSNIKAHTVNLENGKMVKSPVNTSDIFEQQVSENFLLKKFTFPDLKEGSIIEYQYDFTDEYIYSFSHDFQRAIPIRWSEIELILPQNLQYRFDFNGTSYPIAINEQSNSFIYIKKDKIKAVKYHFAVQDIPALITESFVMNMEDHRAVLRMYISSLGSGAAAFISGWNQLNYQYNRFHNEIIQGRAYFKNAYKNHKFLIKSDISPKEKMVQLYNSISKKMKWNGDYAVSLAGYGLNKVFKNKTGSSAEINFLLLALLKEADIQANPVLISTRDNGITSQSLPILYQFNHVILKVSIDGKDYFLDAIHPDYPYNILEFNNLTINGWQTMGENIGWINIPTYKAKTVIQPKLTLQEDGQVKGTFNIAFKGYPAVELRQKIKENTAESSTKDISAEEVEEGFSEEEISNYSVVNLEDKDKPLQVAFDIETANFAEKTDELIYFSPVWLTQFKENPFMEETRHHPVNLGYQREELYILKLQIPKGYQVESLPKAAKLNLLGDAGKFMFVVEQDSETQISVTSRFKLSKPIITASDYTYLKQFFELVAQKHNEQIVLKKKP